MYGSYENLLIEFEERKTRSEMVNDYTNKDYTKKERDEKTFSLGIVNCITQLIVLNQMIAQPIHIWHNHMLAKKRCQKSQT